MKNHAKSDKEISKFEISDQALLNRISPTAVTDLSQLTNGTVGKQFSVEDVYRRLAFFQECGVEFDILQRQYCQLRYPLDLLDIDKIKLRIPENLSSIISAIECHTIVDSTNSTVLNSSVEKQHAKICMAEYQTAGRGRHGRHWLAPLGSGLCLSLGWHFLNKVQHLQLISLLPAVALIRVLHNIGVINAGVKWPNDVICNGQKLAGILIEKSANYSAGQAIVIGVGINVYNRSKLSEQIQQPWTTIDQQLETVPSRNELVASLITELLCLIRTIEKEGLDDIRDEWRSYDALINTSVSLVNGKQRETGIAQGINDDGSLSVEINGELKRFISGEISIKLGDL